MSIITYFRRIVQNISGPLQEFPLTVRIFHSMLAISMVALVYNIPLNIIVGLPYIALASAVTLILVAFLYYLSRYRKNTTPARLVFCFIGTALFVANFFLNSGIDGPTGYFFILMAVVVVAIVPVSEYWYWVSINFLLIFALHWLQYYFPQWVPYTYPEKVDRYIDVTSAYMTVIVVILACFYIIRKNYDSERLAAQQNAAQLLELDAEKNKLFSIISHDLRSPLSHIQNYLELLSQYELTDEERRDIKAQLLRSTRGTLDMVNNILYWSKNQMSGGTIKKEVLNVSDLLESQIQLFRNIAAHKQIRMESMLQPNAIVLGNPDMVQLIVRNLLNNAIKFTSPGGQISISANLNNNTCLIIVKDNGNGSPAQLTEDIFQLSADTSRGTANESGVGLGLVLCSEYTALLNGRIWFSCDMQSGTTFFVELPTGSNPTS